MNGTRAFSPIQQKRLTKLNIHKTHPSTLTEEVIRAFVRLDIDPTAITRQLEVILELVEH